MYVCIIPGTVHVYNYCQCLYTWYTVLCLDTSVQHIYNIACVNSKVMKLPGLINPARGWPALQAAFRTVEWLCPAQ